MKAWRVVTGHEIDHYGYITNIETAKYFLNENKAKEFYKQGEYTYKATAITTIFKNGYKRTGTTDANFYKMYLKRAETDKKNNPKIKDIIVEIVNITENHYRMEEIEIEE